MAAAEEQQDLRAADRRLLKDRRNLRDDPDPGWQPDRVKDGSAGNLKDLHPERVGRGKRNNTGRI